MLRANLPGVMGRFCRATWKLSQHIGWVHQITTTKADERDERAWLLMATLYLMCEKRLQKTGPMFIGSIQMRACAMLHVFESMFSR
jgi:hypothetical protein